MKTVSSLISTVVNATLTLTQNKHIHKINSELLKYYSSKYPKPNNEKTSEHKDKPFKTEHH